MAQNYPLTPEVVASLPPPGLSAPSSLVFSPSFWGPHGEGIKSGRYLSYISSRAAVLRASRSPLAFYPPLTNGGSASTSTPASPPTASSGERTLQYVDLTEKKAKPQPLLSVGNLKRQESELSAAAISDSSDHNDSLEERLRRERQRLAGSGSLTQFSWTSIAEPQKETTNSWEGIRLLIPVRGSLFLQNGVGASCKMECMYDKTARGAAAVDAQLSPDGSMVAWTCHGDIYVQGARADLHPVRLTFGSMVSDEDGEGPCISHGVADFVAQEEMDRYKGFWWHPDNSGILLTRVDETNVPLFRIMHQDCDEGGGSNSYEDHRYPFAGKENPKVRLAFLPVDKVSILDPNLQYDALMVSETRQDEDEDFIMSDDGNPTAQTIATQAWDQISWLDPPREASEYLARVHWLPDGSVVAQWQNRTQTVSVWQRISLDPALRPRTLLIERSEVWINLHHMFYVLDPISPSACGGPLEPNIPPFPDSFPSGSFSFILASERTGFQHLYLYTYCPGMNSEQAILIRTITAGKWMVESIVGVDVSKDAVYFTGTYDSVLERHLYAAPITNGDDMTDDGGSPASAFPGVDPNGVRIGITKVMNALSGKARPEKHGSDIASMRPLRLTIGAGMHSISMDEECSVFSDTWSDLDRPTSVRVYALSSEPFDWGKLPHGHGRVRQLCTLYDASKDDKSLLSEGNSSNGTENVGSRLRTHLPSPELVSFPTSDGLEILHAAVYSPDPTIHGPGPYPLICAVYGGPHVQRVNRSWSQCSDMRAQRLRSLGFVVAKCDNRGSSRRGLDFESAIQGRLGRLEVLDQVTMVRHLVTRGIVDPTRVGIYGWSYGGYLSAMCLFRAPDVFHVAVAGAPVTSWDGYDTHYTERYMGLPADNQAGYRESAVFDHIPNLRGRLMIVHGLIDENVHFRHSARLINKLVAAGKDYELLIFPDERHSPRRLRDRIYMERRISEFFSKHLATMDVVDLVSMNGAANAPSLRNLAGRL